MFLTFTFTELLGKASILKLSAGWAVGNPWKETILFSNNSPSMCFVYLESFRAVHILSRILGKKDSGSKEFISLKRKKKVWIGVTFTFISTSSSQWAHSSPQFKICYLCFLALATISREPSPKILVRIGDEKYVMMVSKIATLAVGRKMQCGLGYR